MLPSLSLLLLTQPGFRGRSHGLLVRHVATSLYTEKKYHLIAGMFGLLMRSAILDRFAAYLLELPDRGPLDWLFAWLLWHGLGRNEMLYCAENLFFHDGATSTKSHVLKRSGASDRIARLVRRLLEICGLLL